MSGYRLVEYGAAPGGSLTLPRVYRELVEAVEQAEWMLEALAPFPHRRPYRIEVIDVWTRETVTRIVPNVDRDPDVCAACGAPSDPFAALPSGGDTNRTEAPTPAAEADSLPPRSGVS